MTSTPLMKNAEGVCTTRAFTLIELLIAIAIIGIIAAIIVVTVNQGRARAQETAIVSDLKNFAAEANILHSETGSYLGISDCKDSESGFNKFVEGIEQANGTVVSCTGSETDWSVMVNYPATEPTKSFAIGPSGAVVQGEPEEESEEGGGGGVTWFPSGAPYTYTWYEGVSYCAGLGGRLPTLPELVAHRTAHGGTPPGFAGISYWTSTEDGPSNAQTLFMAWGATGSLPKSNPGYGVYCVS